MHPALTLFLLAILSAPAPIALQPDAQQSASVPTARPSASPALEFLTPVDPAQGPLVANALAPILKHAWLASMPAEATSSPSTHGSVVISFVIDRNGKISAMHLDEPSGNPTLDKAAWNGMRAAAFPPLPASYTPNSLKARAIFFYNQTEQTESALLP
jgi:TonB family protein